VEVTAAADRPPVSEDRHPARAAKGAPRPLAEPTDLVRAARGLAAKLEAAGFDPDLAREVSQSAPVRGRRGVTVDLIRRSLTDTLSPLAAEDADFAPIEVFVGPPGAGKTTTIAKIAAQERARNGRRLGLVAADGFRVGAVEQLRLYANILGAPLSVARTPFELEDALDAARGPLLLDTAGRSPSDEASRDMLRVLAGRRDVRTHLVLAAGTPRDAAHRILDRFADARPARIVLTKLDETETLAPIVPLLRDRALPVSFLGTGQGVPEDLERATAAALAAWVSGDTGRSSACAR
jgi:flagellar biosynthesis protein FlhF